ncbi:MAG: hypothetical protein IVW53_15390, partial [Chloroflexi bacterium]|nr:hypothetical protein [Chloroflexota bacterium]
LIHGIENVITAGFDDAKNFVLFLIHGIENVITAGFDDAKNFVLFLVKGTIGQISALLDALHTDIDKAFADAKNDIAGVAGQVGGLAGDIGSAVETGTQDLFHSIAHGEIRDAFVTALKDGETIGRDILSGVRVGDHAIQDAPGAMFNQLIDIFIGHGEIEPGDAPRLIAQDLVVATEFGLLAHSIAVAQGAIPTENADATSNLAAFVAKFADWDTLIEAGLGVAIAVALKRPMEQHLNKQTLSNIPNERDIDELISRRKIDSPTYAEIHARHGYAPRWTEVMQSAAFHPARIFEIARVMQFSDIDDAQLHTMLLDAGYRDEVINALQPAMRTLAMNASITKLVDNAWTAYRDGFISRDALTGYLTLAGKRDAEKSVLMAAADLAYANAQSTEIVSAIRSAAGRGAMTADEQRASLAGVGVTGAKADIEVQRAHIAQLKKPVGNTPASQTKAINATRATLTTAYKEQFKKGLIDASELNAQLIAIGIPDFQAAAIVTLTQVEVAPAAATDKAASPAAVAARVRTDLKKAYITQFAHGAIDAQTLGKQLIAVGFTTAETEAIVALEEAKAIPKPTIVKRVTPDVVNKQVRDTLAKAYEEQHLKGMIDADTLEADFIAVGIDPQVAHARRLLDEAKATPKPKATPSPA